MTTPPRPALAAVALLIAFLPSLPAVETEFAPSLQFSTGLAGGQNRLTWPAQPGTRYRIRSSEDLSPGSGGGGSGGWRDRALVEAEGTTGTWLDPEPASPRAFYQVEPPQAEVFSVEPAVLSPGAVLVITGQCLPAGSVMVFEIEGIPPVTAPIVTGPDGRMTVTLPAFAVITQPGSGIGPHVRLASVTGPGGVPVCVIGQTFEATLSGFASDSPQVPPPVIPLGMAINEKGLPGEKKPKKTKSHARTAGGGDDDDCDDGPSDLPQAKTSECKNNIGGIARRGALPGEVHVQQCDLILAVPAGPPLVMVRTYRSMIQPSSACGTGWDHGYNMRITPVYDSTTLPDPTRLAVHTGDGRVNVMSLRSDGTYGSDGTFSEARKTGLKQYGLIFADQGSCSFHALDGSPQAGKLHQITDRNGVSVTCHYDAATGLLASVSSQFGQSLTFLHDSDGRVTKVTDQTTRFVAYSYYAAGEPGGNPGDLKSVSCPMIPGEAPVRGPETYTYTTGSPDPNLNSNLLTSTDGAGRLIQVQTYTVLLNGRAADYDRCLTSDLHSTDPAQPVVHFSYEFLPGSGGGAGGLLCIANDEMGRVTEVECDRQHRPLRVRSYSTFAAPGLPVTSTTNRPPAPSDPKEPAFLQTTFAWNPDHLCNRLTEPDGLQTRTTYDGDLRRNCPRRERGNARIVTLVCPDDSEPPRTVSMEYQPGLGTCEGKKGLNAVNVSLARNNSAAGTRVRKGMQDIKNRSAAGMRMGKAVYEWMKPSWDRRDSARAGIWAGEDDDDDGGCTDSVSGAPIGGLSIKGGRNPGGGSAMRPGNPIGGLTIKGGKNPGGNLAARAAGGGDDDCDGPDDDDWLGASNPIPGVGIVVKRNPGGNSVAKSVSPLYDGGGGTAMNPLFERDGFCTTLTTTCGQVFTWNYDTRGNCTSSATPIPGSGTVCTYNTLGQCTGVTIHNGPGSSFHRALQYDAATQFLTGDTVDPDVNGDGSGLSLTTILGRNALGLVTEVLDPRGQSTLVGYNACDQPVSISSPPLGSDPLTAARVVCTQLYDLGGLPVRCDLEHRDATGALVAGNPYYTGFCVYNIRGELVMEATEQKPVDVPPGVFEPGLLGMENFHVCDYGLDHAGQVVHSSIPAASRHQAGAAVCDYTWNALGLLSSITTGDTGTPGAVTTEFRYSTARQVTKVTVRAPAGAVSPAIARTYDAWRRPSTFTDEMGTVTSWSYANDGFVTVEVHGKAGDVEGPEPSVLLARGRGRDSGDCDDRDDNPSPLGMAINEKGLPGEKKPKPKSHARTAGGKIKKFNVELNSKFFDVFTTDDVWTWERFAPGEPAPHATETTTVHHSPAGLPLSVTRNGDVLYLFGGYDTAGRLTSFSRPGAVTVTNTLDACGNVTASTLTAHSTIPGAPGETFTTAATFDAACRPASSTDSAGNTGACACDSLGRPVSVTQPGGLTVTYAYDTVSSTGTFASCTAASDFDADGLPDYSVSSTSLGGSPRSTTDAAGYTTVFTCDSQNRITRTDYPDGTFETTAFNELGHPVSQQRRSGALIAADYNYKEQARRVTVSNLPPGVVPVPPTERVWNGLGHCVQVTEGASIVVRTRDSLGNLLSESQNGHTITHTYDHRGSTGTGYPGGERFREQRNAHGMLLSFSVVNSAGITLSPPITQRAYLGFACVREERRNGVVTTCDYRSDGEPALSLGAGGVEDFTFGGCVRTTITGSDGTVLENHITRRNRDQCETQHHRAFAEGAAPPSRRMTFTLNPRNFVTRCVTQVRLAPGSPVVEESNVSYELDARGQRLSATGGTNPGLYSSNDLLPPGDRQAGQYSSWPGGDLEWDADGCLTQLNRTGSSIDIIYDAFSRATEVRDENGFTVATYAYDADSRRISSTVAGTAGTLPVTTFFLYDGSECIQELQETEGLLVPEMTYGVSGGAKHCIITKNGSTYYPNGGGGSTDFVFPILPAWIEPLKEIPVDDDITLTITCLTLPGGGSNPRIGRSCDSQDCAMLTTSAGTPAERYAATDSCQPIFLNSDGLPTGVSSSSIGYRWLQPGSAWCPESGLFQCSGGLYSPELGQPVSSHKEKPKKPKPVIDPSMWDLATNKKL